MPSVTFRVYAELNDFLPPRRRKRAFVQEVAPRSSVKDAIEALGVPHPEVDLLLVDGQPAGFSHLLLGGERVAVYPRFRTIDVAGVSLVSPGRIEPRFVLDVHLGRLAAYLRLAGFDAAYNNDAADSDLAASSSRETRVLLTRDVGLLYRNEVRHGYFVRETLPARQLLEVIRHFALAGRLRPFTRCLRCNVPVEEVTDESALAHVPPRVRARHTEFRLCPACGRVYWKGTHYEWMTGLLRRVTAGPQGVH